MSTFQVRTLDEADHIIKEHERKTKNVYALLRSTKNFGCVDVPDCANEENEVRFETVGVPYCGAPFYVAGIKILQCQSFKARNAKKKQIKIEAVNGNEEEAVTKPKINKKKKMGGRINHRVGCTATIIMKEIIYYPEFQIFDHSKNNRIAVSRHLKDVLKSKGHVQKDRIIYITVPSPLDHFGHPVSNSMPPNVTKLYVKNDVYGQSEAGGSKRIYYPVKQEKAATVQLTKRFKIEEDDADAKAKEVREMLQSIMALTYKPGTVESFSELHKDLSQAKQKYNENLHSAIYGMSNSSNVIATISTPQQVLAVHSPHSKGLESTTTWPKSTSMPNNPQVIPSGATVVAVATLPISVSSNLPLPSANTVTIQQPTPSVSDPTNQETSIFLEAMEAIFNPQM